MVSTISLTDASARWSSTHFDVARYSLLRVECHLATPVAYVEPIHLDALLAWVVAYRLLHSNPMIAPTPEGDADDIAIPATRSLVDGLPVWHASSLHAQEPIDPELVRYRKRPPEEDLITWSEPAKLRLKQGRFRAYDLPVVVQPLSLIVGHVHGSESGVRSLLSEVRHVGKKRSQGYGRVLRWQVDRVNGAFAWQLPDGKPSRVIPSAVGQVQGYRPPYWHRPWWAPCVAP
jgi:hypothetical protein